MRFILKKVILLFLVSCTILSVQSCKEEEGCTDQSAENYSADAEKDDGSCTYARTKFIGTYGAGESCNGADATSNIVVITESDTATNAITITNETLGVTVMGVVTGDNFTINDSFILNGSTVDMVGDGTYSVDDDGDEQIDVQYTLDVSTSCIALWLKN